MNKVEIGISLKFYVPEVANMFNVILSKHNDVKNFNTITELDECGYKMVKISCETTDDIVNILKFMESCDLITYIIVNGEIV